ncbi:hypothetical protein DFH09DRAFT_1094379 [Mycena vulgaris]|nr:hypothetical protein DFH09DRAFT_1094379 [Mycena vulgaris]
MFSPIDGVSPTVRKTEEVSKCGVKSSRFGDHRDWPLGICRVVDALLFSPNATLRHATHSLSRQITLNQTRTPDSSRVLTWEPITDWILSSGLADVDVDAAAPASTKPRTTPMLHPHPTRALHVNAPPAAPPAAHLSLFSPLYPPLHSIRRLRNKAFVNTACLSPMVASAEYRMHTKKIVQMRSIRYLVTQMGDVWWLSSSVETSEQIDWP